MSALRIGGLCSGYGGLELAVQAALGGEIAWVADTDPGAARILAHHHPDVPNLGDITQTDWSRVEPVDVLAAGFPCQPISNAGRRRGVDDARWIWPAVVEAARVLRPGLVLLENVAAIASRGLDRVLADLAEIGFDAEWTCLRASDVGAPHRRERWFLLAWPADAQGPRLEGARLRRPAPEHRGGPAADPAGISQREPADEAHTLTGSRNARPQPSRGGLLTAADPAHLRHRHPRPPGLGRVPAAAVGGDPARAAAANSDCRSVGTVPHSEPHEPAADHLHDGVDAPGRFLGWGPYEPTITRWEDATGHAAPVPTEPGRTGQPRLNPVFVEWLMGLDPGWVTAPEIGLTRTQQLHALGNGVIPAQGAAALRRLLSRVTAEHPRTLTA